jgi:hypothetical protein
MLPSPTFGTKVEDFPQSVETPTRGGKEPNNHASKEEAMPEPPILSAQSRSGLGFFLKIHHTHDTTELEHRNVSSLKHHMLHGISLSTSTNHHLLVRVPLRLLSPMQPRARLGLQPHYLMASGSMTT